MHIGILQTGHLPDEVQERRGDYDILYRDLLKDRGLTFSTWAVVDDVFPDSVHDAEGWLITGSRHGAYEDFAWIPRLEAFIREAFAARVPMVGICFGHQIIAQALGGRVEKSDKGWAVGVQTYQLETGPADLNVWHQDQVVAIPDTARPIARNAHTEFAELIYDDVILTTQAHPEFDAEMVDFLLTYRAPGVVPDDRMAGARARLAQPTDNTVQADRIAKFFKEAAA